MHRLLGLIAIVALTLFAVPVSAQQETGQTGQDTSAVGRQGEGLRTGGAGQTAQDQQQQEGRALTTRQGTEQAGQEAGQQGGQQDTGQQYGQTDQGVTQPTGAETTGGEYGAEGGAMPTTASPLPWVGLAGASLIALGLGWRFARRRS